MIIIFAGVLAPVVLIAIMFFSAILIGMVLGWLFNVTKDRRDK